MSNFKVIFAAQEFGRAAERGMNARGMDRDDLHYESGVSHGTLARLLAHGNVRKIEAIYSVAAVLNLDVEQFLTRKKIS